MDSSRYTRVKFEYQDGYDLNELFSYSHFKMLCQSSPGRVPILDLEVGGFHSTDVCILIN